MSKEIVFGKEARIKILKGAEIMSNAVSSTLGPFGKNVIIKKEYNDPQVTKDGVTVANNIRLKDQLEDIGALMVRQAARKTADNSGDGTTTTSLLAYTMMRNAMDIQLPPLREVKDVIDGYLKDIYHFINDNKIAYRSTEEMLEKVSLISSNGDMELTDALMSVYRELGDYADIIVETSPNRDTTHKIFPGMYFEGGYKAKEFITDSERGLCVLENVALIITDQKIHNSLEIEDISRKLLGAKFSILFVSPEIGGEAMFTLTRTAVKHKGKVAVVKSPGINVRRAEMLEDIAVYTGGQVIRESRGENVGEALAGKKYNGIIGLADKVVIREDSTTILGGKFDQESLNKRVEYIISKRDREGDPLMRGRFDKRISGLTGGVGIIYIGGASEVEVKEKQGRMDDCIQATKSAMEMGVALGGGHLFAEYSRKMMKKKNPTPLDLAIAATLEAPLLKIWKENGEREIPSNYPKYLKENHIVDPVKVLWDCISNAMTVAYAVLSTNAVIVNDEESQELLGDLPTFDPE